MIDFLINNCSFFHNITVLINTVIAIIIIYFVFDNEQIKKYEKQLKELDEE